MRAPQEADALLDWMGANVDAWLDTLRLLRHVATNDLASSLLRLRQDPVSRDVAEESLGLLRSLFSDPNATGSRMAVRAVEGLEDADTIAQSCAILAQRLLHAVAAS